MKPTYLELCAFGPFAGQVILPLERIVSEGVFLVHGATGAGRPQFSMRFPLRYLAMPAVKTVRQILSVPTSQMRMQKHMLY